MPMEERLALFHSPLNAESPLESQPHVTPRFLLLIWFLLTAA